MFTLLAVLTALLAIISGVLTVAGLMRRVWPILLTGVLVAGGAVAVGVAAYQHTPPALIEAFLSNSAEIATTLSLLAIALSLVATVGISAPARSRP